MAVIADSSDDANTFAPLPKRLGKLRVEVDSTVALSATRAVTIQSEHPGISNCTLFFSKIS